MKIRLALALAASLNFAGIAYAQSATEVPAGEIAGIVTDENGRPIEDALVDAWTWYSGNETHTDALGHFHLKKLVPHDPGSRPDLRISKDGYDPFYVYPQKTGVGDLTVALSNRTYFEGDVLSPDGKPVSNARVRAAEGPFPLDGMVLSEVWTETTSDSAGHYRLYVRPDKYDFQVHVSGVGAVRLQKIWIGDGEIESLNIALEKGITFKATLIDADSGEPISGAGLSDVEHEDVEGTSDADGIVAIDGLFPAEFDFDVHAKDYARWWTPQATQGYQQKLDFGQAGDDLAFIIKPNMDPVTILMQKAAVISGHVYDPQGMAVAGATVAPARTGDGRSVSVHSDARYSVLTGDDGGYQIVLPASGDLFYNLVAHDGKEKESRQWANGAGDPMHLKPGEKIENVDLKLTIGATVKGHVVGGDGDPAANIEVRAVNSDGLDNRYYVPSTRSDKDGNYELKFIRPGEQIIRAEPFSFQPGQAPGESKAIILKAGDLKEGIDLGTSLSKDHQQVP